MRLFTAINQLKAPALAAVAFFVLLLTGCGQKGDLYQPKTSMADNDVSSYTRRL